MAIIKTSDLPSAASLPNKILSNSIVMEISKKDIQIRGLGLSNNEGVYFPVHFLIKKYGYFAVIVSESYQLGPQITSLQTILNNFEGTRKFTFEISFLLDRSKFQRLDTLNMALSFDVRIATQNWDNELTKLSEIKGLDKIINEVKQTSMNVNVSINYTTKKKGSLETIVGSLSSLKKLITLGRDKGAIQRAVLHSKDSNGYEELINLLYERITPNDFVFFALNDSRMVDEDFVYKTLKQTLLKNEEFILRALENENII